MCEGLYITQRFFSVYKNDFSMHSTGQENIAKMEGSFAFYA